MASFISSFTSRDWSPTWLVNRLLRPQFLFQSTQSCSSTSTIPCSASMAQSPPAASPSEIAVAAARPSSVSQQEMVALGRIFDHFDENKDGKISRDELHRSLHMLGIEADDEELIAMIDAADWNSDGSLDFSEFAAFYYCLNEEMGQKIDPSSNNVEDRHIDETNNSCEGEEADLRDAFKLFDKNGDGFICAEELQSVLASMGLSQGKLLADCRNMIRSVDVDGDGQVSFDEFKQMMAVGFGQEG